MNQPTQQSTHMAEVRELSKRFDAAAIENCIQRALQEKDNPCYSAADLEEVMGILVKANFVTGLIRQGKTLAEAIRELGQRIRAVQGA